MNPRFVLCTLAIDRHFPILVHSTVSQNVHNNNNNIKIYNAHSHTLSMEGAVMSLFLPYLWPLHYNTMLWVLKALSLREVLYKYKYLTDSIFPSTAVSRQNSSDFIMSTLHNIDPQHGGNSEHR